MDPALIEAAGLSIIDPPKEKPALIDSDKRRIWNEYVDYLEGLGLKGSPKLNSEEVSKQYFNDYLNSKGIKGIDYTPFVTGVQQFISDYRNKAIQQARQGKARIPGMIDYLTNKSQPLDIGDEALADKFMKGLSAVDGLAGQYTTSWKFPNEFVIDKKTGKETDTRNSAIDAAMAAAKERLGAVNKR